MLSTRKRKKSKRRLRIFIILLVFSLLIFLLEKYLEPLQDRLIINRTKIIVEQKFAEVVKDIVNSSDYDYDRLLVKSDKESKVSSLSLNTKELNKLEAEFSDEFQDRLEGVVEGYIGIPLGDLTTLSFVSGMGPEIPFSYDITGAVSVKLNSTFDSTGINQTIHRVNMKIRAEIVFITIENTDNLEINGEYQISETVIVGDTPDYSYRY